MMQKKCSFVSLYVYIDLFALFDTQVLEIILSIFTISVATLQGHKVQFVFNIIWLAIAEENAQQRRPTLLHKS